MPQVPFSVWLVPAAHPVAPVQLPHTPQVPHEQSVAQERARFCEPELQLPHTLLSFWVAFGVQPGVWLQLPHAPHAPHARG